MDYSVPVTLLNDGGNIEECNSSEGVTMPLSNLPSGEYNAWFTYKDGRTLENVGTCSHNFVKTLANERGNVRQVFARRAISD
jgi:hypothetical protein